MATYEVSVMVMTRQVVRKSIIARSADRARRKGLLESADKLDSKHGWEEDEDRRTVETWVVGVEKVERQKGFEAKDAQL